MIVMCWCDQLREINILYSRSTKMVKFLIHKPISVIMTFLGVLILGIYAIGYIPVSLMPDIDIPEITVQVASKNMSPRQLEDAIIKPLRDNLMQLSHLKDIKSEATNEMGIIHLTFNHGTKIDYSFIEVNEKIDLAMGSLPRNVARPKVIKASASDIPVFYLSLNLKKNAQISQSQKSTDQGLYPISQEFVDFNRFVNQVIRKRIEQVNEVAMVDVSGLVSSEILIIPDEKKLSALGISLGELESDITSYNLDIGSLSIKDNQYQYNIRLGGTLNNIQEIENIYIHKNDRLFQLKDLAEVLEHPKKRTGLVLSDGKEAITMAIIKQSDARMGDLKVALEQLLSYLEKDYPNIEFSITRDQTKLLEYSINNLLQDLFWGILLAFAIMFLFLKEIKSPLLVGITIPVSMIICLLFFYFFGITINIISLSGLVLGSGLMIDNSIIVIDNITQYRVKGYKLSESCILGTQEVLIPLLTSALTNCSVFLPLVFLSGIAGALFYDQAMAITMGLFASFIVSVTFLPLLYRLFHLNETTRINSITRFLQKTNTLDYEVIYEKGFRFVMRNQLFICACSIFLLIAGTGLYAVLPKQQLPALAKTEILLKIDWNESINVEENKRRVLELLEPFKDGLISQTALIGSQQFLLGKTDGKRASESTLYLECSSEKTLINLQESLNARLKRDYPKSICKYDAVDNVFNLIFADQQAPLVARLRNVENLGSKQNEQLIRVWKQVQREFGSLELKAIPWQEYITLEVDKEKLMIYNLSAENLYGVLKSAFNERQILSIIDNQDFVPVILGGSVKSINEILNQTEIRSNDGTVFNVNDFIKVRHSQDLKTIEGGAEGEYYPLELNISDKDLDTTVAKMKEIIKNNKAYDVSFSGNIFNNNELIGELITVLLISLLLLYFILASQFESFILPIMVLIEIPIDLAGAFLFLKLFGMSINLMSMIGIVVMSGIVINDSILKVDTIVQLQKRGVPLMKSLIISGHRRLKPILMTFLITVLSLMPLLLSNGLGVELQAPLAVALIGGMLVGTPVSLYFVPLFYYHIGKWAVKFKNKKLQ